MNQSNKPKTPKRVPDVTFKTHLSKGDLESQVCLDFEWLDITTNEIFKGKKIVLFALPGAFTPTCSKSHLPGYEKNYDEFKKLGIDEVVCLSVNDSFVMFEWGKNQGIKMVKLLADGNGEFTDKMGMLVEKNNLGFGKRSWRYSMLVDDGIIKKVFVEATISDNHTNDPFQVSDAGTMLKYLKEN